MNKFYWFDSSDNVACGPFNSYRDAQIGGAENAPSNATVHIVRVWSISDPQQLMKRKFRSN